MEAALVDQSQSDSHLKPSNVEFGESLGIILADKKVIKLQATHKYIIVCKRLKT